MNPDSLEGSIQKLLSALYPPFEATAPTVLSQLFQVIESRYQGDALRCLLDFLVPAKHILESIQQAACAQYSDVVFLCEGWPLCLCDQIVIQLAPINPLLLQPGDFYLQVAPFCDQSARIVVCSLLEEEGLRVEVVEEIPVPETFYPCIFTSDWLEELNQGRHGTPLSQCLLATEQGVVRLPWQWVAVPEFVDGSQCAVSSMASASPSSHLLPPPLPLPASLPPLSCAAAQDSPANPPILHCPTKESPSKQFTSAVQSSTSSNPSPHPSALTVETRICPAKYGIAVSLCLVDARTAASSRPIKAHEVDPKPIGWVSPNTWDTHCTKTGTCTATDTSKVSSVCTSVSISENTNINRSEHTFASTDSGQGKHTDTSKPANQVNIAERDYIDILQATMLFGGDKAPAQEQQQAHMQSNTYTQAQRQPHTQVHVQTETHMQTQVHPHAPIQVQAQSQVYMQSPTKPMHTHSRVGLSFQPNMPWEARPLSHLHDYPPHHPHLDPQGPLNHKEPSQCVRTVRFSEKPCTPCMRRRQGGNISRAQELRCRYRESYQAALKNPVTFGREEERGGVLSILEEDADGSPCEGRQELPEVCGGDPWCRDQRRCCDPGVQNQSSSPVHGALSVSGQKMYFPGWNTGEKNTAPTMDYLDTNAFKHGGQTGPFAQNFGETNTLVCSDPKDAHCATSHGISHSPNGTNAGTVSSMNITKTHGIVSKESKWTAMTYTNPSALPPYSNEISDVKVNINQPYEVFQSRTENTRKDFNTAKSHVVSRDTASLTGRNLNMNKSGSAPQHRRNSTEPDGRCSSLSTTVVDTSEKCEVIMIQGQNVRRRESTESSADLIPRLHVVKCKNTTAFGLVSPKINRRRMDNKVDTQPRKALASSGHQTDNLTHAELPSAAETQQNPKPGSAQPRPDHLPLGSPDPGAHPLQLGLACLTGGRDRTDRAIVEVPGDYQGWRSTVTSQELYQVLLYFHSIIRREIRELGVTLIVDARKTAPPPQLYKALMTLKEHSPNAVHCMVLLVDKENSHRPERCPGIQNEVVPSLKALYKIVEACQLTSYLDGTLSYNHHHWLELHQKLHPFVSDLLEASSLLLRAIRKLEETQKIDTVQGVQQCIVEQRTLMRDVLEDSRLVGLQREGGAMLARLRRESDLKYPHCEDFSDAVDSVSSLYNHVEEQAHVLVQRSNISLEHLEYLIQIREMQGHFRQIREWFDAEGVRRLLEAESVDDSRDQVEKTLNSLTAFLIEANDRRHHAMSLVSDAEKFQCVGLSYPETESFRAQVSAFKSGLENFLSRAEACCWELQVLVNVCDFCEQATALARECKEFLGQSQSNPIQIQHQDSGTATFHPSSTNTAQDQYLEPVQNITPPIQWNNQPMQHQKQDCGPCPEHHSQSNTDTAQHSVSTTTNTLQSDHEATMLHTYQERFLQFSPERFQEIKAQANTLRGSRGMRIWNLAWLKCQEARQQLQERVQDMKDACLQRHFEGLNCEHPNVDDGNANVQTEPPEGQNIILQSTPGPRHPQWEGVIAGTVDIGKRRPILGSNSTNSSVVACCDINTKPDNENNTRTHASSKVTPGSPHRSHSRAERETNKRREMSSKAKRERDAAALSQSHTVGCQWFPWRRGLGARSVSVDSCATVVAAPTAAAIGVEVGSPSPTPSEPRVRSPFSCSRHGQPSCRILQEAQRFQISRHGSFCSEESCSVVGEAVGSGGTSCCKHSSLPIKRCEGTLCLASPEESASNAQRLQRVMEELVFTEREYVRSLGYILTHYHPLLDRPDIPQDLRGKRGVIFGNLEKLYDFHSHYFLPELEACQREPVTVARCFLRHSASFGLYALYSKNKPQSDALILHRRHDIFKRKQQELGDLMDLSSYLLRPIQRISKYSLLLQDMLALAGSFRPKDVVRDTLCEAGVCGSGAHGLSVCGSPNCGPRMCVPDVTSCEREQGKAEIQAAADLVRFQMRHGNDLLTMDAIQDCDVNLKEQGQLIRQDEFIVLFRKKKCVRRVFLFEHLILFSKTKRTDIGNDVYVYKQSFKTCDIGMTQNSGVSDLCFEIWFRRRKREDTYTLKVCSMEVKKAWISDLERILWEQAAHSRELRMQERVFMGMGRKTFMDIQPSSAAICDTAINCVLPRRVPVYCSHSSLDYPRPNSIGSGSTVSTTISQSSSSSGRGSLPPIGYPRNQPQGVEVNHVACPSPNALAENELNNHHLHQHHLHHNFEQQKPNCHLLALDSTESSGECVSHFSSSGHSCLSAVGGEVVDSSSSFASQTSKPRPSLSRTPSLRTNGSPAETRKKPSIAPKPLGLTTPQDNDIIIGKSTEV